jgi:plastocyanin
MKLIPMIFVFCLLTVGALEAFADEQIGSDNPKKIAIHIHEYRFEPAEISLKVGEEVELTLINDGTMMHEFITEALQALSVTVKINGMVAETLGLAELEMPPGTKTVLRFTPETPGEFLIACRAKVPKDHYQEGMRGRFLIR